MIMVVVMPAVVIAEVVIMSNLINCMLGGRHGKRQFFYTNMV